MRAPLLLGALACGCSGADAASEESFAAEIEALVVCQQGLGDRTYGDKGLFELCEGAGGTVVRDTAGDGESYPAFTATDDEGAYRALFEALDSDGDGDVDHADAPKRVHLVGFSWGGFGIPAVARRLRRDERVVAGRRGVERMVLLDPFRPHYTRVPVPGNVAAVWVYRQSETTEQDCSYGALSLWQGFNGREPVLESERTRCRQYDLDAILGDVGHCGVVEAAARAARQNLRFGRDHDPWAEAAIACALE